MQTGYHHTEQTKQRRRMMKSTRLFVKIQRRTLLIKYLTNSACVCLGGIINKLVTVTTAMLDLDTAMKIKDSESITTS